MKKDSKGKYSATGDETYLEVVKHPRVLEGRLAHLGGLLLVLLDGTLVDTTALVDQVTSRRGLAGIDVANHHQGDVNLILGHFDEKRLGKGKQKERMGIGICSVAIEIFGCKIITEIAGVRL